MAKKSTSIIHNRKVWCYYGGGHQTGEKFLVRETAHYLFFRSTYHASGEIKEEKKLNGIGDINGFYPYFFTERKALESLLKARHSQIENLRQKIKNIEEDVTRAEVRLAELSRRE